MSAGRKLLSNCTDAEIMAYSAALGYTFTLQDCEELRALGIFPALQAGETLAQAVSDFLNAFER